MKIFDDSETTQSYIATLKKEGNTIGFAPTMGYLHDGHKSLLKQARLENDIVVLSIFVNPTQFAPNEDFDKYPRDLERDINIASQTGADIIFCPKPSNIYPPAYSTYVEETVLSKNWCGAKRHGHFKGVSTIVLKLFNIIMPDKSYFGAKDIQQALIIKKMVHDLNLTVDIVICPIIREHDGLALSSRNVYLNTEERKDAALLKKSLDHANDMFKSGITSSASISTAIENILKSASTLKGIDYIACASQHTLEPKQVLEAGDRIMLAVYIGTTRLIDNCQL